MMTKEKLYDAFGELIYVVAIADGIIQKEEKNALKHILTTHPWASEIQWSFDYEVEKHNNPEYLYQKVLDICYQNGPDPEYAYLIEVLEIVAEAGGNFEQKEKDVINRFTKELTERFKKDLEKIDE